LNFHRTLFINAAALLLESLILKSIEVSIVKIVAEDLIIVFVYDTIVFITLGYNIIITDVVYISVLAI